MALKRKKTTTDMDVGCCYWLAVTHVATLCPTPIVSFTVFFVARSDCCRCENGEACSCFDKREVS